MPLDLAERLRVLNVDLNKRSGRRDFIKSEQDDSEVEAKAHEDQVVKLTKGIELLQAAQEARRQELHDRVEALITRGLRAVFMRPDLEFFFQISMARNVFGVTPMVRSMVDGQPLPLETEIVGGRAGGIADVVSFVLRVLVLCLTRPRAAPVLILDETFRHVSAEFRRGCATLLKELNRSAGVQFIVITHQGEMLDAADVIYRASFKGGITSLHLEHDLRDDSFHARPKRGESAPDKTTAFDRQNMAEDGKGEFTGEGADEVIVDTGMDNHLAATRAEARARIKGKPVTPGELDLPFEGEDVPPVVRKKKKKA